MGHLRGYNMFRDMQKAIEDYKKTFCHNNNGTKGAFYASDIQQIYNSIGNDAYSLIANALEAGFMIGYRCAKREKRNKTP